MNAGKPTIVIAGAGPAGMMLAYQLVSNGVPVRVIEQHPDFDREFRGDLIGPSVLPTLERLGLLSVLVRRGQARVGVERCMYVGATRRVTHMMFSMLGVVMRFKKFAAMSAPVVEAKYAVHCGEVS